MRQGLVIAAYLAASMGSSVAAQDFFTLKGHGGPIMDVAVSPSGQIATASFDNAVGLWSGAEPIWLDSHGAAVTAVAFADVNILVSGGDDFTLLRWRSGVPEEMGQHSAKISAIAVSARGDLVASASWDGTIGLWSLNGGTTRFLSGHKKGVNDVALSDDGDTVYSASSDGTIRVWGLKDDDDGRPLIKHGFGVNRLILNEADGWLAYGAVDGGTRMIDLNTGTEIADFTLGRRPILAMAYHPESGNLAVGDGEGYIMLVDTKTRSIAKDFKAARNGPIWALAFSPDGQNLHAGGIEDTLYSWPIATMTEHRQMATGTRSFLENPDELPNGERQFKRKCSICHALTPGSARKAGPTLHNIFGRAAGSVGDYRYSKILQTSDIVWDEDTIDALFDQGPDHFIPGTKMPMQVIAAPDDRRDLIAFLRDATAPVPQPRGEDE